MRRLAFCLLLLWMISTTLAQDVAERYFWEAAGVYIPVPTGWAAPLPLEQNGAPVLLLKPALTGAEAAGGTTIQFKLLSLPENPDDLAPLLKTEFEAINLNVAVTQPVVWLDGLGLEGFGTDEAEAVYGRGRIFVLGEQTLVMMASGPIETLDALNTLVLDEVFGSSTGDINPGQRPYGVLWQRLSTGADGEQAIVEPQMLAVQQGWISIADGVNGILAFNAATGAFMRRLPDTQVTDMAVTPGGVYFTDAVGCLCLNLFSELTQEFEVVAQDFGPQGPGSVAADGEERAFVMDMSADGQPFVRVFQYGQELEPLLFETPLSSMPLLFSGPTVHVLLETGEIMEPAGAGFQTVGSLTLTGLTILDSLGEEGFLSMDDTGGVARLDLSGQITPLLPISPDNVLIDAAIDDEGTLYTLEQIPQGTALTAWGLGTVAYGTGRETLVPEQAVTGRFDSTDRHIWLIRGQESDIIDLTAELINPDDGFIMDLQLLDSSGTSLGTRTLTTEPSDLVSIPLEATGLYFLVVNRVAGSVESYSVGYRSHKGISQEVPVTYHITNQALSQAMPIQRYIIPGKPGIVFTAHVTATSGTLDPSLRLVNPRGTEVEVNEDLDPSLGLDAELTQIRLSNTGDYVLEIRATSGEGLFYLTISLEN